MNELSIIAKQNNREIYLMAYSDVKETGFIADLEQGVRHPDDNIQAIRKKGFWVDIQCSQNVIKSIMKKVSELKALDSHHP